MPQSSGQRKATSLQKSDVRCEVPKIGLIIVDYFSWTESREAVSSALNSCPPFDWIIIVDNGGTVPGGECRAISDRIILIRAERNGGFAYGVNLGLQRLKLEGATHAMILNPDARLRPRTMEKLLSALQQNPEVAIVGPVVFSNEAETKIEFSGASELWHLGWLPHRTAPPKSETGLSDEPFITGCCWLMSMNLVEELGEMPEGYFLYFEDTDYCQRARRLGYRLGVVPDASVVHYGSQTVKKHSPLFRYQLARNRIWFMRRWARADQYATFLLFTVMIKLPLAFLLFGLRDRDWSALSAFLKGCWHGLAHPAFSRPEDVPTEAPPPEAQSVDAAGRPPNVLP